MKKLAALGITLLLLVGCSSATKSPETPVESDEALIEALISACISGSDMSLSYNDTQYVLSCYVTEREE